jgi:hypothetical protein
MSRIAGADRLDDGVGDTKEAESVTSGKQLGREGPDISDGLIERDHGGAEQCDHEDYCDDKRGAGGGSRSGSFDGCRVLRAAESFAHAATEALRRRPSGFAVVHGGFGGCQCDGTQFPRCRRNRRVASSDAHARNPPVTMRITVTARALGRASKMGWIRLDLSFDA